jgi:hypothetical protein
MGFLNHQIRKIIFWNSLVHRGKKSSFYETNNYQYPNDKICKNKPLQSSKGNIFVWFAICTTWTDKLSPLVLVTVFMAVIKWFRETALYQTRTKWLSDTQAHVGHTFKLKAKTQFLTLLDFPLIHLFVDSGTISEVSYTPSSLPSVRNAAMDTPAAPTPFRNSER